MTEPPEHAACRKWAEDERRAMPDVLYRRKWNGIHDDYSKALFLAVQASQKR